MSEHSVDPVVSEAVQVIENRFGVQGLEDLIEVATRHLTTAREATAQLGELVDAPVPGAPAAEE